MWKSVTWTLAVLAVAAPSAMAERVWTDPVPLTDALGAYATVAATAADGTSVAAWLRPDGSNTLVADLEGHAPVVLGQAAIARVAAAPGGQAVVVWSPTSASSTGRVLAVFARADGTFSDPADVGVGTPQRVVMNARGDAAVEFNQALSPGTADRVAFRPAGGAFGAPVQLPVGTTAGIALTPTGETLVLTAAEPPPNPIVASPGLAVSTRDADGPLGPPVRIDTPDAPGSVEYGASVSRIAADAAGRAIVVWSTARRGTLATATRSQNGTWSEPVLHAVPQSPFSGLTVAAGAGGDAVITWRDLAYLDKFATYGGAVWALSGSMVSGAFGQPQRVDAEPAGAHGASAAIGADGTAVVAYDDLFTGEIRTVRRAGPTAVFDAPLAAVCNDAGSNASPGVAGVTAAGDTTLVAGTALVRDAEVAAPRPALRCRRPTVTLTPKHVVRGRPVTIRIRGLRRPYHRLGRDVRFRFSGRRITRPQPELKVRFPRAGRISVSVAATETSPTTGTTTTVRTDFTVRVHRRYGFAP